MKKLLILSLVFASVILEAKLCTRGCTASYSGVSYGYAWHSSNCAAPPVGVDVYYAEAGSWGGHSYVYEQGVMEDFQGGFGGMAC